MKLVVPMGAARRGQAEALVRRYFEERFPKSEHIEIFFNGRRCCYLRVTRVHGAQMEDGRPTSKYQVHQERFELEPGFVSEVGLGVEV